MMKPPIAGFPDSHFASDVEVYTFTAYLQPNHGILGRPDAHACLHMQIEGSLEDLRRHMNEWADKLIEAHDA